jgi:hypothetical protein
MQCRVPREGRGERRRGYASAAWTRGSGFASGIGRWGAGTRLAGAGRNCFGACRLRRPERRSGVRRGCPLRSGRVRRSRRSRREGESSASGTSAQACLGTYTARSSRPCCTLRRETSKRVLPPSARRGTVTRHLQGGALKGAHSEPFARGDRRGRRSMFGRGISRTEGRDA